MATANISFFGTIDFGGYGRGAQCFDGNCEQDRVDAVPTTSWPGAPHATVAPGVSYAVLFLRTSALVYAGSGANGAAWEPRAAAYPPGWWPIAVSSGDKIAIKELSE